MQDRPTSSVPRSTFYFCFKMVSLNGYRRIATCRFPTDRPPVYLDIGVWFATKLEYLTFHARMIFSPLCIPHRYGRGYCCLTDGIEGRRMCICALLQEFVREDPHTMFRKGREEECFRILVSRYLVEDEKKYRDCYESVEICFKQYFRLSKSVYQPFVQFA